MMDRQTASGLLQIVEDAAKAFNAASEEEDAMARVALLAIARHSLETITHILRPWAEPDPKWDTPETLARLSYPSPDFNDSHKNISTERRVGTPIISPGPPREPEEDYSPKKRIHMKIRSLGGVPQTDEAKQITENETREVLDPALTPGD